MLDYYGAARRFKYVPPQTEETVIFPFNAFTFDFDTTNYAPSMTNNKLSSKEVRKFLTGIGLILQEHKRILYNDNNTKNTIIFLVLILTGAITNAVLIPVTGKIELLGVGLGIIFIGMLHWLFNLWKLSKRAKRIRAEARQKSEEYILQRKHYFEEKGLRWVMPYRFPNWMELWKDYVYEGGVHDATSDFSGDDDAMSRAKTEISRSSTGKSQTSNVAPINPMENSGINLLNTSMTIDAIEPQLPKEPIAKPRGMARGNRGAVKLAEMENL